MDDSAEILFKSFLREATVSSSDMDRDVRCLMLSIQHFLGWTSLPMPELLTRASCRKDWKRISAESSLKSPSDDLSGRGTDLN